MRCWCTQAQTIVCLSTGQEGSRGLSNAGTDFTWNPNISGTFLFITFFFVAFYYTNTFACVQ